MNVIYVCVYTLGVAEGFYYSVWFFFSFRNQNTFENMRLWHGEVHR